MKTLSLLLTSSLVWAGLNVPAQSAEPANNDVAIIIGNKSYNDQDIPEVRFAHNDAKAMRLFAQDVLKIRNENILYIEDATQAKMQSAFGKKGNHRGKAFQYVRPNVSNLYVFYSGHGIPGQHDKKSYLLPVDAEIETAEINGYPTDVLYENLSKVDAKSVTVFLDACFSGNSQGGSLIKWASGAQILPKEPIPEANGPTNLTVLTAASQDQLASWDEENKHGLFTEYLLRALYGAADQDKDGEIKLEEVNAYLNDEMRYKARRTYNRDQVPTIIGDEKMVMVKANDGTFPSRPTKLPSEAASIDITEMLLTPVEQNMFAIKTANIREEPSVQSKKVAVLNKGEPIHVAAKITDRPWYAVESGNKIIGFVFADLLGEEKEIATEEENRAIRELKARLEKLEQQTRLSSQNVLPPAPTTEDKFDKEASIIDHSPNENGELFIDEPQDHAHLTPTERYNEIKSTLKTMGSLLVKQNFKDNSIPGYGTTSLNYNWIKIDADRCSMDASIDLHHDKRQDRALAIEDRQLSARFDRDLRVKNRTLQRRDQNGELVQEIPLYNYGPFIFKNRDDRRRFLQLANGLKNLCPQQVQRDTIGAVHSGSTGFSPRPAAPPPPPPPQFRRPPPPRF